MSDLLGPRHDLVRCPEISIGPAVAVLAVLILPAGTALAACEEHVARQVRGLGLQPFEFAATEIIPQNEPEVGLQGYKAWVRLQFCRGYLVLDLDDRCSLRGEYTTGDCDVPGVPRY